MGPLESTLCGPGRDRRTHLPMISPVVLESSVWSQDPTPPAPGSPCPAQQVWDQPAGGWPVLSLSSQRELGLSGNKRERGSHACNLCFPQRSMLPAPQGRCLRSAGPPPPAPAGIRVLSPGTLMMLAPLGPGCQAGWSKGEEGRGLHAPSGSKTQCWRPGSDFPRNSLDETRTAISQTQSPHQRSCLLHPQTAHTRRLRRSLKDHRPLRKPELNKQGTNGIGQVKSRPCRKTR